MKKFTTIIEAINPHTGELNMYNGPAVEAETWDMAQIICDKNIPYCKVDGEYLGEEPVILKYELN